jgi:hypothetical protein
MSERSPSRYALGRGTEPAAEASFLRNFVNQWWFESGLEDEIRRMAIRTERTFAGRYPPVEGYNPFEDREALRGFENNLHFFRDSRSPAETEAIKRWVLESKRRQEELEAMVGHNLNVSGFLAGILTPGNILTGPLGIGRGFVRGALTGAAQGVLGEAIDSGIRQATMPAETAGNPPVTIAGAAIFGAALGGAIGKFIDMQALGRFDVAQARLEAWQQQSAAGVPASQRVLPDFPDRPPDMAPPPPPTMRPRGEGEVPVPEPRVETPSAAAPPPPPAPPAPPPPAPEPRPPEPSPNAAFMEQWASSRALADRDGLTQEIEARSRRGETETKIAKALLPDEPLPVAKEIVRDVRATLGFPDPETRVEFEAWLRSAEGSEARMKRLESEIGAILRELEGAEGAEARRLILEFNRRMDQMAALADEAETPASTAPREVAESVATAAREASESIAAIRSASEADMPPEAPRMAADAPEALPATQVAETPSDASTGLPGPVAAPSGAPPPPPRQPPVGMRMPKQPSENADRIAPGALLDKLRWRQMPWHYLKNLPKGLIPEDLRQRVSQAADLLADSPGLHYVGERLGWRPEQSVENAVKVLSARLMRANRALTDAWFAHLGVERSGAGTMGQIARRLTTVHQRVAGGEGKMTWSEFNREVGMALAQGSHPDPNVMRAMKAHREFYDWYQQQAIDLGLLLTPEKLASRIQSRAAILNRIEQQQLPELARMLDKAEAAEAKRGPRHRTLMTPEMKKAWDDTIAELRQVSEDMNRATEGWTRLLSGQDLEAYRALVERRRTLAAQLQDLRKAAGQDTEPVTQRLREKIDHLLNLADELHVKLDADRELQERMARMGEKADQAYVPHVWMPEAIARDPSGLAEIIAKDWVQRQKFGWEQVRPDVVQLRADALVANMAGGGPGDALRAVLVRWNTIRGMTPDEAASKADAIVRPLLPSLRESGWNRLKREVQSLRGKDGDREWTLEQRMIVSKALEDAEVPLTIKNNGETFGTGIVDAIFDVDSTARTQMDFGSGKGHAESRTITAATADLAPWLHLNADELALQYHRTMAPLLETARRFGDANLTRFIEALRHDLTSEGVPLQVQDRIVGALTDLRDVVADRYGMPSDPTLWTPRILRMQMQFAVLTQMGKAVLSAVTDLGRTGWAIGFREMFGTVLDAVAKERKGLKMAMAEADEMGAAAEMVLMSRAHEIAGIHPGDFGRTKVERFFDRASNTLNLVNLLAPWTDLIKRFTGAVLQSQIVKDSVAMAEGTITPERLKILRERVSDEMALRIAAAWDAQGRPSHGRLALASTPGWQDQEAAQALRGAIARVTETAVPTPGAADRPLFMREPWGRMVFLYRGFALGATQRVLGAALQERDKRALSGITAMIALAWLVEGGRQSPHERHPIMSFERLYSAVERSGVMGILTDVNTMVEVYSGNQLGARPLLGLDPEPWNKNPNWVRLAGTATLGGAPALEPWMQAIWAFTSDEATGSQQAAAVRRLILFNNLLYWDGLVSSIQRDVGSTLEGK